MKAIDELIKSIPSITKAEGVRQLIVEHLCCGDYKTPINKDREKLLKIIEIAKKKELDFQKFNKLLHILGQDRVNKNFFNFFFEKSKISLNDLKKGIIKFKMVAMLCFGNFRIAYHVLSHTNKEQFKKLLGNYFIKSAKLKKGFKTRQPLRLSSQIEYIEKNKTWLTGYISQKIFNKEFENLTNIISVKKVTGKEYYDLAELSKHFLEMKKILEEVEKTALRNKDKYLKLDFMDVYIATSMRRKWEYEEANEFMEKVFNNQSIKELNLQYLDPTQSKCSNRIDKGLMEGLMLKRARCTIYMVQESDTLGKDSELAATLAQGKPVIAYVPRIKTKNHLKKIKKYPLDFFERRLLILKAEKIFEDEDFLQDDMLKHHIKNFRKLLREFQDKVEEYRGKQPFALYEKKDEEFKNKKEKLFGHICTIIAIAEHHYFEKRAKILREYHPLSIQVELKSGVANGVLVVRNSKECAELLYRILTNSLEFVIKEQNGVKVLEEEISKSPFRVVTNDIELTNAFWRDYHINRL